jgi:hypothetical protein
MRVGGLLYFRTVGYTDPLLTGCSGSQLPFSRWRICLQIRPETKDLRVKHQHVEMHAYSSPGANPVRGL